jgi:type I restriction enzyme, S subunit
MTYRTVPLGQVVKLQAGVGFPVDLQGRSSGTYPLAKVGDISRGGRSGSSILATADHYVDEVDLSRLRMRPVPAGSVLFAKIGEAIRHNHRVVAGRPMLLDNNAMAAVPGPDIDGQYLYHFLRRVDFYRLASATTVPALRKSDLERIEIPLPVREEQRRIAEILDRAEALRAKRRGAIALLDDLTESIYLDMFGDPTSNPRGYDTRLFGQVCETRLGKMLDAKQHTGKDLRPYLRNANVQWFTFDLEEVFEMDIDERSREILLLRPGDLLICEGGEPGRAAVWQGQLVECYFQKALHRARPDLSIAEPTYLAWFLWFSSRRGTLKDFVTAATIAHLTGEKLRTLPVVLPPIDIQRRFVSIVAEIDSARSWQVAQAASADALFAALQHRAFAGLL